MKSGHGLNEDISLDENDITCHLTSFSSNEMSSFGFSREIFHQVEINLKGLFPRHKNTEKLRAE